MAYDLAAIYLRYRDTMHRVAYAQLMGTGAEPEAEDVVSEVMIGVMNSPPAEVENWEAYLVRAVKNRATDRLRSAAFRHNGGPLDDNLSEVSDGADIADDVAHSLDQQRQAAIAWDLLSILSAQERKVVWDIEALGRTRQDVATELDVTPSRVTQIKNAALKKLRDEMQKQEVHNG